MAAPFRGGARLCECFLPVFSRVLILSCQVEEKKFFSFIFSVFFIFNFIFLVEQLENSEKKLRNLRCAKKFF